MFWVKHRPVLTSYLINNIFCIKPQLKLLGGLSWHDIYTKELVRLNEIYKNEYDTIKSNVLDYNNFPLLIPIFIGYLKRCIIFLLSDINY